MQIHLRSPYHQKLHQDAQQKIIKIEGDLAELIPLLKQQKHMDKRDIRQLHKKIARLYAELRDWKRRAAF